jgi:hypothetical protein
MTMRLSRTTICVATLACLALATPTAYAATTHAALATGVVTLDLELNEPAGSLEAADSSGFGTPNNGDIGSHIVMNGSFAKFDRHPPDAGIYYGAAHLIMIDDDSDASLDPGNGNFTVEFRFRSTVKFGNVIQKGQATTVGGQVKFQQPGGYMSCMFKSPTGKAAVKSTIFTSDGAWHTIRCERTPSDIKLYIDDVLNRRLQHTTGTINNSKPWTIGGKFDCDTSDPTTGADSCDYWAGDMDWVKLYKG